MAIAATRMSTRRKARPSPFVDRTSVWGGLAAAVVALLLCPACSLKRMAVNRIGDALASGSSVFVDDDDPELVGDAVPFALKTTEALLREFPRHRGLLFSAASGFAQYAFAFVQQQADFVEAESLARATEQRARARRLFLRGRDYGLRGFEVDFPGFGERLRADPAQAVLQAQKRHVPLLYWTSVAWFGAINLSKDDSALTADQYVAEALVRRALALDEGFQQGTLHDILISWEARGEAAGGSFERAREHFERAAALGSDRRAAPFVTYAESVCVARQDRKGFEETLARALAVDPAALPEQRLTNIIFQRRARWLLARADELFIE
jgi:predicted anti-sigma-YlaC factor YlaD